MFIVVMSFKATGLIVAALALVSILAVLVAISVPGVASAQSTSLKPPTGLRANGDQGTYLKPRATVRWDAVSGAEQYHLRYRENCTGTTNICQLSPTSWTSWTSVHHPKTETVLLNLRDNALYEIQIRTYKSRKLSDWSEHVFVYTTSSIPNGPVGSIELAAYHASHEFDYTICWHTFSSDAEREEVESAIDAWPESIKWEEDSVNIITSDGSRSKSCSRWGDKDYPRPGEVSIAAYADGWEDACPFALMSRGTTACTNIERITVEGSNLRKINKIPYIVFRPRSMTTWTTTAASGALCSNLYTNALHEAGHAFGLLHAGTAVHAEDSVMRNITGGKDCEVGPFDAAAIMAIYQSHETE